MVAQTSTLRTFVGVPLSEECRSASGELLRLLRGPGGPLHKTRISCPPPDKQHLTLKFLGDTDPLQVGAITAALARIAFRSFSLALAGAGFFPNAAKPAVFWAGAAAEPGTGQLATLARQVNAALAPLGFAPETRPYHAHLTLGRVRERSGTDWDAAQRMAAEFSWPKMRVTHFVLWKSELGPGGAVYTPLGEFRATQQD